MIRRQPDVAVMLDHSSAIPLGSSWHYRQVLANSQVLKVFLLRAPLSVDTLPNLGAVLWLDGATPGTASLPLLVADLSNRKMLDQFVQNARLVHRNMLVVGVQATAERPATISIKSWDPQTERLQQPVSDSIALPNQQLFILYHPKLRVEAQDTLFVPGAQRQGYVVRFQWPKI